ncbi:hypothetical protein, partial [Achromobacter ruhlandii]|uniref:hypothetical protein n=1 Tax=Achromobacter ruhlandii TaxID=72557 RepID=UPI001B8CC324
MPVAAPVLFVIAAGVAGPARPPHSFSAHPFPASNTTNHPLRRPPLPGGRPFNHFPPPRPPPRPFPG